MENAKDRLEKVFASIIKEAAKERWSSNLTNYVGHIVVNGITYEVTVSLERDIEEMAVDPMGGDVIKLVV